MVSKFADNVREMRRTVNELDNAVACVRQRMCAIEMFLTYDSEGRQVSTDVTFQPWERWVEFQKELDRLVINTLTASGVALLWLMNIYIVALSSMHDHSMMDEIITEFESQLIGTLPKINVDWDSKFATVVESIYRLHQQLSVAETAPQTAMRRTDTRLRISTIKDELARIQTMPWPAAQRECVTRLQRSNLARAMMDLEEVDLEDAMEQLQDVGLRLSRLHGLITSIWADMANPVSGSI
ncbi:hypothetical protein C8Q80DRAFT_335155 [Daedaleopsis nitida]|nr:hypothetical protein C8Q80DRAFT_335155 [Daedaleopsis nitida]